MKTCADKVHEDSQYLMPQKKNAKAKAVMRSYTRGSKAERTST